MLYKQQPDPPQVRHRCRNPRCGGKLKVPTDNPRDAFCCKGCEKQFYSRRCRVCEGLFSPKTSRRIVCGRDKCRYEFKCHSERYFGARSICAQNHKIAPNDARSAHSTGLKSDAKPGRGWRIVAGPVDIHPINLRAFPADAAASKTGRPGPVLFTRETPPLNVIGGYRFPSAPKIDLRPAPATPRAPAGPPVGDGLSIPAFLKREPDRALPPRSTRQLLIGGQTNPQAKGSET